MRRFLALACLALVSAVPARAALNRWTSAGPAAGGPVDVLAFDPSQPGTVYAATYGGVFRSEDHGATWTSASFGLAAFQVSHLEVDPLHPGTVYAITQRGFQKSQDGGRNWQVPVDMRVTAFAMSRLSPQNLLAADGTQIYASFDAGASWEPGPVLPGEDEDVRILEIDPQTPSNVYAGTHESFFRSTDGGASFVPLAGPGTGFLDGLSIDPANPQILYAATIDGVFKSTDRGLTWARAGQELAGKLIFDVAVDPTAPSNLLAVGSQVYRSTDGGASWTLVFDRVLSNRTAAFDPSSPSTWLIGTQEGVYRSTNQGASWLPSSTGLFASLVRKLAVDPHRPGVLYAALHGAGTLHKSADAGASWSRLSLSGVRALALDPKTPSRVYAATDQGILRSQDAGSTWVRINSAETTGSEIAVDPKTPSTLYLATSDGVRKSVDGGIFWSATGPQPEDFSPFLLVIAPSAPQTVFAGDFLNRLFKSIDGGATWTVVSGGGLPDEIVISLAVDPTNADVLYAGVEREGVYKSTDGGATWFPSRTGLPSAWTVEGIAIDPSEPARLYAAVSRRGIYRSTNGGSSWALFDDGRPTDLAVDQVVLDPVNPFLLYAASYGSGVLARADLQPGSSLRLNGDRFLVKMSWATAPGISGPGHTAALTGDTGYAWFFQESNVEVLLKVLDGCGLNGRFWVFAAGLTNVRTDITVADTQTGAVRIYHNPSGQPFQPIQDTNALACGASSASGLAASKEPATSSGPLLLHNGRFQVTAEFAATPGSPLPTQGAKLTDDAAYLWFFDQNNVEVFLKVVDGCPVNGRFWVFAAGLTNVELRITVLDTQNGQVQIYSNPAGTPFTPVQDTAAFAGCS
jgi:photosystem II stability/assembly factor-like uncharacterized protein